MPDARRAPVGVGEVACRDEGRPGWEEGEREDGFRFPRRAQRQGSARRFGHGELQEPRDGTHQEGHADLVRAPEPSQGDTPRHITETRSLVGSRVSPSRLPRSLLGPLGARRSSLKRQSSTTSHCSVDEDWRRLLLHHPDDRKKTPKPRGRHDTFDAIATRTARADSTPAGPLPRRVGLESRPHAVERRNTPLKGGWCPLSSMTFRV